MRDRQDDANDAASIEEEVQEWFDDEDNEESEDEGPKVGRPRVPECWSRCISL